MTAPIRLRGPSPYSPYRDGAHPPRQIEAAQAQPVDGGMFWLALGLLLCLGAAGVLAIGAAIWSLS